VPVAGAGFGGGRGLMPGGIGGPGMPPPALFFLKKDGAEPDKVADFARKAQAERGGLARQRDKLEDLRLGGLPAARPDGKAGEVVKQLEEAKQRKEVLDQARAAIAGRRQLDVQGGKLGVDLSVWNNNLRNQTCVTQTALRCVADRNCLEIGGVWIDDGFDPKMPVCSVKAMSEAYFRLLEKQPRLKEVFKLGNHLVWVTPNQTALVIDTADGKEKLSDAEIEQLFALKK
jgi:Ca-activated chloride channel family protein